MAFSECGPACTWMLETMVEFVPSLVDILRVVFIDGLLSTSCITVVVPLCQVLLCVCVCVCVCTYVCTHSPTHPPTHPPTSLTHSLTLYVPLCQVLLCSWHLVHFGLPMNLQRLLPNSWPLAKACIQDMHYAKTVADCEGHIHTYTHSTRTHTHIHTTRLHTCTPVITCTHSHSRNHQRQRRGLISRRHSRRQRPRTWFSIGTRGDGGAHRGPRHSSVLVELAHRSMRRIMHLSRLRGSPNRTSR